MSPLIIALLQLIPVLFKEVPEVVVEIEKLIADHRANQNAVDPPLAPEVIKDTAKIAKDLQDATIPSK